MIRNHRLKKGQRPNTIALKRVATLILLLLSLLTLAACANQQATPTPTIVVSSLPATATPTTMPTVPPTETSLPTAVPPTVPATYTPTSINTVPPTNIPTTASTATAPAIPPTRTMAPVRTATRVPNTPFIPTGVTVSESSITLTAYPFDRFLVPRLDAAHNYPYNALDRNAYDQAVTIMGTETRTFRTRILENEYLKLTIIPDLGGRIYQVTYKPTGQNLFYNNHVLKPSPWGPPQQGGWLAAGGMEWALPVNEHGYDWGTHWDEIVQASREGGAWTLTYVNSRAGDHMRAVISITLPPRSAYFIVHPRIENPTSAPTSLQFWINAQLSLGASKNVSPNTEFILPTNSVFVHSTADSFIPDKNVPGDNATAPAAPISWPVINGVDLSRYSNWQDYLGVFATDSSAGFAGVYNHDTELGMARVFPPQVVPGVKLFAFGPHFCCRDQFTDDGSDYFELWGGLPRTFFADDDVTLAPGEVRAWDEYWLPFAKTGGLSAATRDAVLYVNKDGNTARVSAAAPIARQGILVLMSDGTEYKRWGVSLSPGVPFTATAPATAGRLELRLLANDGTILAATR